MSLQIRTVYVILAFMIGFGPEGLAAPNNKQLNIGTGQEFDTLNQLVSSASASHYLAHMTNRSLIVPNADWKWECQLCVEIPTLQNGMVKTIEEGGQKKMVVSWKIKPEAVWSDGTPVTGKDIQFSWEVGTDLKVSVGERDYYDRIESITPDPIDPKAFSMKYKKARYDYYQLSSFFVLPSHIEGPIYNKHKAQLGAYEKNSAFVVDPTRLGLSNGPYMYKEVKLGSHVTLVKNPKWYGKAAAIETVIVKVIPNTQTLEANLVSGTIDMIGELGLTFDQAIALDKRLKKQPELAKKYKVGFEESLIYEHVELNLDNPILADLRVRKALMHALDRQKLVDALFEGKQKVTHTHVHPRDVYFSDAVTKYEPNLAKAASLLDEAGWKLGSPGSPVYREKDGKRLSLTIMTTAGNKTRELVEVFIQEQFKKVGVELNINNVPPRVLFGETTPKRQFTGLAMFAQTSTPENPPISTMHSSQIPSKENGYGGQNYGGWRNKRNDEILDTVFTEFDLEKRKVLMAEQQRIYSDDVPHFPLYMRADVSVVPTNLKGYRMTGHLTQSTHWIQDWKLE